MLITLSLLSLNREEQLPPRCLGSAQKIRVFINHFTLNLQDKEEGGVRLVVLSQSRIVCVEDQMRDENTNSAPFV